MKKIGTMSPEVSQEVRDKMLGWSNLNGPATEKQKTEVTVLPRQKALECAGVGWGIRC